LPVSIEFTYVNCANCSLTFGIPAHMYQDRVLTSRSNKEVLCPGCGCVHNKAQDVSALDEAKRSLARSYDDNGKLMRACAALRGYVAKIRKESARKIRTDACIVEFSKWLSQKASSRDPSCTTYADVLATLNVMVEAAKHEKKGDRSK